MGRARLNYTTEQIKEDFKYVYLNYDNTLYAIKTDLPLKDSDTVYTLDFNERYLNRRHVWIDVNKLLDGDILIENARKFARG